MKLSEQQENKIQELRDICGKKYYNSHEECY